MAEGETFDFRSLLPCTTEELYAWHARDGALERLIPPWEKTEVVEKRGGIDPGGRVEMRMHAGPIPFRWIAHHTEADPGKMFRDIQHCGPFSSWTHTHTFRRDESGDGRKGAWLEDRINYALPLHRWLPGALRKYVHKTLQRTFEYRHKVLRHDLALHATYAKTPLRILISGASGVLGRALRPLLTTGGHEVYTLVRRTPKPNSNELFWDPQSGKIDDLPQVDAVVHLAGEYIGLGRWSKARKKRVLYSRTQGTGLLAKTLAAQPFPPRVFLCASAVGFYGDTGDRSIDESAGAGRDYISEVCRQWEQAAEPAKAAGIRTVLMRIGISLSPGGGALQHLLSASPVLFSRFGEGSQYISWISQDDTIRAIYHAICCEQLEGPLNIVAPHAVTNADFMRTVAQCSGKPLLFPVPATLLRALYGQMATEILLSGCRARCRKLQESGFIFRHETLERALSELLGITPDE